MRNSCVHLLGTISAVLEIARTRRIGGSRLSPRRVVVRISNINAID